MGNEASSQEAGQDAAPPRDPPPQGAAEQEQMSYWQMAKVGYQELVNAIIRPPRAEYDTGHLGPAEFRFGNAQFRRTDFELVNERGMRIQCSHWEPIVRRSAELPCLVYMHGNSSARVEALGQLSLCLAVGLTCFAFDFSGSGRSDGDYVSLGFFEREDLKVVVEYLRNSGKVSTIALWGRSMGAATALLHGDRDPSIAAMVLDSPFADLTQLAEEMVDKGRENGLVVPGFVVGIAIRMIRGSVQKQAGFNIRDLSPQAHADRCFIPALFVAAKNDDFIKPHHSQQIHDLYAGDKNLVLVEGDHNSPRSQFLFDSTAIFLQTYLQLPQEGHLAAVDPYNNGFPPWHNLSFNPYTGMGLHPHEPYDDLAMGMTQDRQRETQEALYNMLAAGQRRRTNDQPSAASPQRLAVAQPAQPRPTSPPTARASESSVSSSHEVLDAVSFPLPLTADSGGAPLAGDGNSRPIEPWACSVCTFVNTEGAAEARCQACGSPRPVPAPS